MSAYCRNCRAPLTGMSKSPRSSGYCRDCGDLVWAILPDAELGEWYLVADPQGDGMSELIAMLNGMRVTAGQCGTCALSEFQIRQTGKAWDGFCAGQEWDGEWLPGCGEIKPVRLKMRCEVVASVGLPAV